MRALLIRLAGVTAHFRDPRFNYARIAAQSSLPFRTLHCPPPCTIHGLLMAAKGGWIEPETLCLGWRMDFSAVHTDLQRCQLPLRFSAYTGSKVQRYTDPAIEREFLALPVLTLCVLSGVEDQWLRAPANPLSLGRSEDLITEKVWQNVEVEEVESARIARQCLPLTVGSGTIFTAPIAFENTRKPLAMAPRVDAAQAQTVKSQGGRHRLVRVAQTKEEFYVWNFRAALSQE